jgi:hypothetical protein
MVELERKCDLRGDHRREHRLGSNKPQVRQTQSKKAKSSELSAKKPSQLIVEQMYTEKSGVKASLVRATWHSRSDVENLVKTKCAPFARVDHWEEKNKTQ